MAVIEPQFTASKEVEVLLAVGASIIVVDQLSVQDQELTNGPFVRMSVCPNGRIVACFTRQGNVWVTSSDFTKNLSDFSTKSQTPPTQIAWCGTDSVVLYWDNLLLMVGPYGDWLKCPGTPRAPLTSIRFAYDYPLFLVSEMDGVRIIGSEKVEFLQRVPGAPVPLSSAAHSADSIVDIFKIGSCSPAAMLYDAVDLFERKDAKADENLRSIMNRLTDAVDVCIDAAAHEWDPQSQKQLLKAASYGKSFAEFYPAENFVSMAKVPHVGEGEGALSSADAARTQRAPAARGRNAPHVQAVPRPITVDYHQSPRARGTSARPNVAHATSAVCTYWPSGSRSTWG